MRGALYYALGGGLGHITRARALLSQWDVEASILIRSEYLENPVVYAGLDLLPVPDTFAHAGDFAPWLQAQLYRLRPHTLYLDSFPAGLFGELCGMPLPEDMRIQHLARLLRWDVYCPLLRPGAPRLHQVDVLEPLAPDHQAWLEGQAEHISDLEVLAPALEVDDRALRYFSALPRPRWLVVHSGPDGETAELLEYAREQARLEGLKPALVLITQVFSGKLRPGERLFSCYPAAPLFPLADRIISACGFNTMRQTLAYRERHRFLPMPRRLDDQFARAAARHHSA